jgi:hypothetical protein
MGTVLLVGREADLPEALTDALTGTPVARVNTLELAQVVNTLDRYLHFSKRQWQQLAAKHGFRLKDRNAELRREGRYGRPEPKPDMRGTVGPLAAGPVRVMGAEVEAVQPESVNSEEDEVVEFFEEPIMVIKPQGQPATVVVEVPEKGSGMAAETVPESTEKLEAMEEDPDSGVVSGPQLPSKD